MVYLNQLWSSSSRVVLTKRTKYTARMSSGMTLLAKKYLWVLYIAISLMFVQGAQLHVHTYDHDHDHGHAHQKQAHFSLDTAKSHFDEVAEVDLSQQGFVKKLSFGSLFVILFMVVAIILPPRLLMRVFWRYSRRVFSVLWLFSLRPPLRAPPLK